jgi:hypothetical protein
MATSDVANVHATLKYCMPKEKRLAHEAFHSSWERNRLIQRNPNNTKKKQLRMLQQQNL